MTFDLWYIVRTTHWKLEVFTAKSTGNALCNTGFTGTGRAYKAEDFSGNVTLEFADGNEFENAVFDVL